MTEDDEVTRLKLAQVALSKRLVATLESTHPDAFPLNGPPVNPEETAMVLAVLVDLTGGVIAILNQLAPESADANMTTALSRLLEVVGVYAGEAPTPGTSVVDI